ncbi:MAG: DNA-directed RNA polymerase subunit beta, partial [Alphaproteobacteria bacterium]|nr:DNA-directed RNA polymerase subunit beta [Alphaproteobacteria bacterium]
MPNLIEVQRNSYEKFLQRETKYSERLHEGLQEVFSSVFPIKDFSGRAEIDFVRYDLEEPKYDVEECQQRGMTYAAPLRVTLRLSTFDIDEDTGLRSIRDIKEQDVYMVDMPLMTGNGTFVVNGTERVIVSQMHRSPGVFFDHDGGKTHSSGKYLFAARVIPYRGSWLDFEFDAKDIVYVRIDRRRKLPVTTLLLALDNDESVKYRERQINAGKAVDPARIKGLSSEEILSYFYKTVTYEKVKDGWKTDYLSDRYHGIKIRFDLVDAKTKKVKVSAGTKITARQAKKLEEGGMKAQIIGKEELIGAYLACNVVDSETGEVIFEAGDEIDIKGLEKIEELGLKTLDILDIDNINVGPYIRNTLAAEKCQNREDALVDIYRVMRPGEPPTLESGDALFRGLFFDQERYDLSPVGRVKMNARLDFKTNDQVRVLRNEDIFSILKILVGLKDGRGEIDDIDHLGNRRVRSVGELMENQCRIGLMRMERAIKERMGS